METIKSNINTESIEYQNNVKEYQKLIFEYHHRLKEIELGGGIQAIEKHKARHKLLARERVNLLIDKNTPFLELSCFAAYDQYNGQFPAAGIITGIGLIHGRETIIVANDSTVKGGTYIKETIRKHIRAQEIALENRLPCVYLVDSGGIFLPEQANVFPDRFDFGRIFYNQAHLSAEGLP